MKIRSSVEWIAYFEANAARRRPVPWEEGAGVNEDELAAIAASLRGWQLGETSDGVHLLGGDLGRFLDLAGVARARWDWGDALFRAFRYALPTMEMWATPVVMVETHAMVYYNALRRATRSRVLRAVCEQILADEVPHIHFQCERLAVLNRRRTRLLFKLTMALHRLIFAGITLAVWAGHRRALRAGGYDFGRFWRAAWGKMRFAWRTMAPSAYDWDVGAVESMTGAAGR